MREISSYGSPRGVPANRHPDRNYDNAFLLKACWARIAYSANQIRNSQAADSAC
jgi:hypothetical protein